jgi:hypothetical protein
MTKDVLDYATLALNGSAGTVVELASNEAALSFRNRFYYQRYRAQRRNDYSFDNLVAKVDGKTVIFKNKPEEVIGAKPLVKEPY